MLAILSLYFLLTPVVAAKDMTYSDLLDCIDLADELDVKIRTLGKLDDRIEDYEGDLAAKDRKIKSLKTVYSFAKASGNRQEIRRVKREYIEAVDDANRVVARINNLKRQGGREAAKAKKVRNSYLDQCASSDDTFPVDDLRRACKGESRNGFCQDNGM